MKILDKEMKTFLDKMIEPSDHPVGSPERVDDPEQRELVGNGVENSSQDELCLGDLVLRYEPRKLRDHLPVFAPPEEIIRIHRDSPEYLNAIRNECEGSCDGCKTDSGCSRDKKQKKKDK